MASFVVDNGVESTVADNPLTNVATTLNVASGEGANFPSSFPYRLNIWDEDTYPDPKDDSNNEVVHVTGRTTDALTIVRGKEGTSGVEHVLGSRVAMLITAGMFNDSTYGLATNLTLIENRATVIENDIDYPTTVKQKAITDTGEDGGVEGGVFNGDFEYGVGSVSASGWIGDEDYGWGLYEQVGSMQAAYDDSVHYTGMQSLRISTLDASGIGFVRLYVGSINNLYPIIPSTPYKMSAMVKTENAAADAVYISLREHDSDLTGGSSHNTSKLSGTNDWTYLETVFTSDADASFIEFKLLNFVAGNVSDAWFDDIKLEQIDTQAVNTQTDEIVGVSVEGVTTTDNIDQYLGTSGNTYTLTTEIDEGATHRQTFTPTADRGDGKHILTKIQALVAGIGTGDWTFVVHDAANNSLASKTIVNGSMSTGDVGFDVPAILDVGTAYHFHVYSTVADGTVTTTDNADLETVDFHAQFAKHTESSVIAANGGSLDMTGIKLLTGATITVNADGSGRYEYDNGISSFIKSPTQDAYSRDGIEFKAGGYYFVSIGTGDIIFKFDTAFIIVNVKLNYGIKNAILLYKSYDNVVWELIADHSSVTTDIDNLELILDGENHSIIYIKATGGVALSRLDGITFYADLDCQAALPIFIPSTEVTTETNDLTLNPIDISEDGYWQLNSDLTGWGSRTFTMLASEAAFESQAVSANYIYMYDSNGTTPWTWDERSGLVPPADRTSGTVTAKFLVGDNQIKSSVNDGSMKANVNLSWNEESLRAAINRLTTLANLQYPIVIEVEDVPAIDTQDQPTGADAETGYTNDVTSLRQTAAATPAIAYTGLLPRENQFSEWLDITVVCSDGDGTLQGKLYTVDGTLIETYADLESNPVITISNSDYKYSRERLILQISASLETTSIAWSVIDIKWRYQYNG